MQEAPRATWGAIRPRRPARSGVPGHGLAIFVLRLANAARNRSRVEVILRRPTAASGRFGLMGLASGSLAASGVAG